MSLLLSLAAFFVIGSFRTEIAPLLFNSQAFRAQASIWDFAISVNRPIHMLLNGLARPKNKYLSVYFLCAVAGVFAAVMLEASEFGKKADVSSPFDLALD